MKTTVEIPDPLFRRVRRHCAEKDVSFREFVEQGLLLALDDAQRSKRFRLKPFGFDGDGRQIHDWEEIRELIYEGRGGVPELP